MRPQTHRLCSVLVSLSVCGCDPEVSLSENRASVAAEDPEPTPLATWTAEDDTKEFAPKEELFSDSNGLYDKVCVDVVDTDDLVERDTTAVFSLAGRPGARQLSRSARDRFLRFVERPALRLRDEWATPGAAYAVIECGGKTFHVYYEMIVCKDEDHGKSFAWRSRLSDSVRDYNIDAAVECVEAYFNDRN